VSALTRKRAVAILEASLRRQNRSLSMVEAARRTVAAFLAAVGESVARVTTADVRRYLALRSRSVSANTLARDLELIHGLYQVLVHGALVAADPTEGLSVERTPSRPPILLSEDTVARFLQESLVPNEKSRRSPELRRALALRDRAMLELLYGVGLRASEVRAVRVVDLALGDSQLLCRRAKRGVSRFLPLPAAVIPHLERYLREGRPLLMRLAIGDDDGRLLVTEWGTALDRSAIGERVEQIAKRLAIKAHPHAFRRSLATSLVQRGASIVAVRELLGHVRLSTTQKYVVVDRDDLRNAVSVLEADGVFRAGRSSSST
jgi:integrase/recombinase XerD